MTTTKAITRDYRTGILLLASAVVTLAALMLLAAGAARAELVVRADLGPVRIVYADPQPACVRPPLPRPVLTAGITLPVERPLRHVCRLDFRHKHRFVFVPGHWERVRGHRSVWVEARYECRGRPLKHGRHGGVVIVRDDDRCDDRRDGGRGHRCDDRCDRDD